MDFVVDAIAIGNHVEAADGALLAEHGITGVLCLARDRMRAPAPAGVEKDAWPLQDGAGNARSDIEGALRKLDRLLSRHPRVLVHCNAGTSRSCGLVSLWLARRERLTLDAALTRVAARRTCMALAPDLRDALEEALDAGA